jgi:hypothetical protein
MKNYRVWQSDAKYCYWTLADSEAAAIKTVAQTIGRPAAGLRAEPADEKHGLAHGLVLDSHGGTTTIMRL